MQPLVIIPDREFRGTIWCVLNHTDNTVTQVYDRSDHSEKKREALISWSTLITQIK